MTIIWKKINVALGQSINSALLESPDSDDSSPKNNISYVDSQSDNEIVDNVPDYNKLNKTNLKIGVF